MRGLKFIILPSITIVVVAPYTGAWIEINAMKELGFTADVAPYTGAWIEILYL